MGDDEKCPALLARLRVEVTAALKESQLYSQMENLQGMLENIQRTIEQLAEEWNRCLWKQDDKLPTVETGFTIDEQDLLVEKWEPLGKGQFSTVFKTKFKGCPVAIKVLKQSSNKEKEKFAMQEGKLLRHLNHDNIIAFRGMGKLRNSILNLESGQIFIVMEYISYSIKTYMQKYNTYERTGFPKALVWDFAEQIAHGLEYLHTLGLPFHPVAHRDLKPDNILLDHIKMEIKLADFGIAYQTLSLEQEGTYANLRWAAPEVFDMLIEREEAEDEASESEEEACESDEEHADPEDTNSTSELQDEDELAFHLRADMFAYGAVVAYCLTGMTPWPDVDNTFCIEEFAAWNKERAGIKIPDTLQENDPLRRLIDHCYVDDPEKRPRSAKEAVQEYFNGVENPYKFHTARAEYFTCGFLKDTKIFVADSLVDKDSEGYMKTKAIPQGYASECLLCIVDVSKDAKDYIPPENDDGDGIDDNADDTRKMNSEWDHHEKYYEYRRHFRKEASLKHIEDNPTIQLKKITLLREGEEEAQALQLEFAQGTYVHHRAMRKIWMGLEDHEKEEATAYKGNVHPIFSTSFGLHVAVITADNKFMFCRRANRRGIASPKSYTCGAVESASVKDYIVDENDVTRVSLLRTAARGLMEELKVELVGDEINVICLSTIYLKYDTHEWGMCGFVHLSDERIAPNRRLTYEQVQSRFVTGPKDKFEHDLVEAIDFNLDSMVDFVHKHRQDFSSSGKLVVVKVLQSFFGVARVEHAFQAYDDI